PLVVISIPSAIDVGFPLTKGWVLKSNQKLGNRGGVKIKKNIKLLLEHFFLSKNLKKDRMSTKNMYDKLLNYAEAGDIEKEDIPQILTIQNWINLYNSAFKRRATENEFESRSK
ncbi:9211_t:CDS:2, partial [Dentiscutata heterogama]